MFEQQGNDTRQGGRRDRGEVPAIDARTMMFREADRQTVLERDELPQLQLLERLGWITLTVRRCVLIQCAVDVALTPKVALSKGWRKDPPTRWYVPTARNQFIEVTGLSHPMANITYVESTSRWEPTESSSSTTLRM